jgi:hypothetical protein
VCIHWEKLSTLFIRIEVNDSNAAIENLEVRLEVSSFWYLSQKVGFVAGWMIG